MILNAMTRRYQEMAKHTAKSGKTSKQPFDYGKMAKAFPGAVE